MQITVTGTVAVRPPQAFAMLTDIAAWPQMMHSITSVALMTHGPVRVGTCVRVRRTMLGRATIEDLEVIALERPRRLRLAGVARELHYERDHVIDTLATGSLLTVACHAMTGAELGRTWLSVTSPVIELTLRDELEQDLADFASAIASVQ